MTEDQKDNTTEGPASDPEPGDPSDGPETTSQAAIPHAGLPPRGGDLPVPLPQHPATGLPTGVAQEARPHRRLDPAPGHLRHGRPGRQPDARRRNGLVVRRSPAHRSRSARVDGAASPRRQDRQQQPPRPQRPARRRRRAGRPRRRLRHRPRHVEQREQHAGLQPDVGQLALAVRLRVVGGSSSSGQSLRQRLARSAAASFGARRAPATPGARQRQLGIVELIGSE